MQQLSFESIKEIAENGDINLAFSQLQSYLRNNVENKNATKLYNKLRKKIYQQNVSKIKEGIKKSEFMLKEGKYAQALSLYIKLQKYAPNYKPLNSLIKKTYKLHQKSQGKNISSAIEEIQKKIKEYLKTRNYQQAIELAIKSVKVNPNNIVMIKNLTDVRRKVIDKKLKENKSFFSKTNPKKVYDFVKSLYQIDPTYLKIQKLYSEHHKKLEQYYKDKKYIFENDAKLQIKVLYNEKEYKKAVQTCDELLKVHPGSKYAKNYRKRSKKKIEYINYKEAYKLLKSANTT